MSAEPLLARLEGVRQTGTGKWRAKCPAHGSKALSLAIRENDEGRTLVHCFAGCPVDEICSAVGITVSDLFPPSRDPRTPQSRFDWKREQMAIETLNLAADLMLLVAVASSDVSHGVALPASTRNRLIKSSARLEANLATFGIRRKFERRDAA